MRKFTVTLISLTAALTAALTITGSATIDTRSETAAVVGGEPKTTGPGDDSHAGHDHGPVAGPGTAQASAPAESAESVGVYRWRHRVITWRLRTPAWTWSAAGQRQSIALAMAVWDSASSRITLRQTSGPADIEISYQEQSHYRGNPDASFGWNDAGHAFYPGSYTLGGDIHINSRFRWGPMGSWAPLRYAVIHEIGHALGIPHAPASYCRGPGSQVPVMCSTWPHPTQLTAWDRWALQATYGR